jgi:uncharacterized protein (DUF362 family)
VTLDGSTDLAAEARRLNSSGSGKVTLACLNADSPGWTEVPSRTALGTIAISNLVTAADRVISIPVLKSHRLTHVSLSLKNFIGTMSSDRYGWPTRKKIHFIPGGVEQTYLDVVASLKPDLAIIDGSICCEGNGPAVMPGRGSSVDMKERLGSWLLLASTDLVAADATAARIIGHDPAELSQIAMAAEQGLGEMRVESIDMVGDRLQDLRVDWRHAEYLDISALQRSEG